MSESFGGRLSAMFAEGRHLCVGVDPHAQLLSNWGLGDDAGGAERMGREVVAAAAGTAACIKPQVAFFERFGSAGFVALERVLADARDAGLLVIADVKRGDIGSSFSAYADAWLAPGAPLEADAMTAVAYQGFGSLSGAWPHIRQQGKGLFVLAATSNPEARSVQQAVRGDGVSVAAAMVADASAFNRDVFSNDPVGSVGVVLGATLNLADFGIETSHSLPVLAPGFGHQGARIEDAAKTFGALCPALLANESRSILEGGASGLAERISNRSLTVAAALGVS